MDEFDDWVREVFGVELSAEPTSKAAKAEGATSVSPASQENIPTEAGPSAQGASAPRKALKAEQASDSSEFKNQLKQAWASAEKLVKDNPKKWAKLASDLKKAKAAGKGPGDWLDETPADEITAYRDDEGKVKGLTFTANMANDDDGVYTAKGNAAETHQSATSLKWKVGKKNVDLDPTKTPYVALPPELVGASGAQPGDLIRMKDGDKVVYGIFGDGGPHLKAGEASMKVQELFRRGLKGDLDEKHQQVEYTIITGSGARNDMGPGGTPHTSEEIQALGEAEYTSFSEQLPK